MCARWEEPDPAELVPLSSDEDWKNLDLYPGLNERPLQRCLEVARSGGARCAVIETRYIDLDYRSEYSAFYSRAFQSMPDSSHRLHFFNKLLTVDDLWNLPEDPGYLGYITIRPSLLGRVGRTMLKPPPGLEEACRTCVDDTVNFFGRNLTVRGVPFVQQDTQLGRCAHAAAWVCHYSAFLRNDVARRPIGDFSLAAEPSLGLGRPLPSGGLTVQQLLELLRIFDLPPLFYRVQQLPPYPLVPWAEPPPSPPEDNPQMHPGQWDTRIIPICCRYLNSGLPVLVGTSDHAFVLSGYTRTPRKGGPDWITFTRNDDQRGPYLTVDDVLNDVDALTGDPYGPWEYLIVPLPDKLWLPPEPAEYQGGRLMHAFSRSLKDRFPDAGLILDRIDKKQLALRTYAQPSNVFKAGLDRGLDSTLMREYRLARFSRFVWVVEAIDRELRAEGKPSVLGEVVFDATSSESMPMALAVHVPGVAWVHRTHESPRFPIPCSSDPYESGGVGPP